MSRRNMLLIGAGCLTAVVLALVVDVRIETMTAQRHVKAIRGLSLDAGQIEDRVMKPLTPVTRHWVQEHFPSDQVAFG